MDKKKVYGAEVLELGYGGQSKAEKELVNQELRLGEAVLDWSEVSHAPQKYFKV